MARNANLRTTGDTIRACLDELLNDEVLTEFGNVQDASPFSDELISAARRSLATAFNAEILEEGYQVGLLEALLLSANDPDASVLPSWLREGFPIGIARDIEYTGIFPRTDGPSAAIKASQAFQTISDWMGNAQNYKSFAEAGDKAQAELLRLVDAGRAQKVSTWEDVVQLVGPDARLTKMACIIKQKSGKEKVRVIVDMRRSGINGQMRVEERVVLPRITDVAASLHELLRFARYDDVPEFYIIDFSDAFYTLRLHPAERAHTIVKGNCGSYFILHCVCFGLSCGPLVWGRLASAFLCLGQAATNNREGRSQCYVDDPILIALGRTHHERSRVFARVTLLWCALGCSLAWHKCSRGCSVEWIGVNLQLEGALYRDLRVCLTVDKTSKLREMFKEIMTYQDKGMLPTALLSQAAGIMGWVSNIIPLSRPWTGALCGAVVAAEREPTRDSTRARKGLTFWKQVEFSILALGKMLEVASEPSRLGRDPQLQLPQLSKLYSFMQDLPLLELFTDACPTGMGAVIFQGNIPIGYWAHQLSQEDCTKLHKDCQLGDPAFQTEWEAWTVVLALRAFSGIFSSSKFKVFLRSDNTATLQASLQFQAKSPLLRQIAAELVLEIEHQQLGALEGRHIRGLLNQIADSLSRNVVPKQLEHVRQFSVPDDWLFFRRCSLIHA